VPDQVELVTGDKALVDEHLVEDGADGQHLRGRGQAFAHLILVRFVLGDRAAGNE